jgi:hypothetical protein
MATDMKPGDIRTFKKGTGNAAVLAIGVWAARQSQSGPIHIHITRTEKFHTTLTRRVAHVGRRFLAGVPHFSRLLREVGPVHDHNSLNR